MNAEQLKGKIRYFSQKTKLPSQEILQMYIHPSKHCEYKGARFLRLVQILQCVQEYHRQRFVEKGATKHRSQT